jgi:hypothetical protein
MVLRSAVVVDWLTSNDRIGEKWLLVLNLLAVLVLIILFLDNWKLNQLSIDISLTILPIKTFLTIWNISLLVTDKLIHSMTDQFALGYFSILLIRSLVPFQIVKIWCRSTFFSVGMTPFIITWMLGLPSSIIITPDTHRATWTWSACWLLVTHNYNNF